MSLRIAIQMDPVETINIDADSTFALALEAQKRGHRLWHYLPSSLSLLDGVPKARGRKLGVKKVKDDHFILGPFELLDLSAFDMVLMRQDPPFDMAYITATHILESLPGHVSVFNNPAGVRNAPEKLLVTKFRELVPPTLISADRESIRSFRQEHGDIILKPLYGNGGIGVFRLKEDDENFNALLEQFGLMSREPLIAQKYIPAVRDGDKRIILVDGEPVGAFLRVPERGEARANLHVGGKAVQAILSQRDRSICAAIGPELRARGLVFAGIDVIGDWLTEINVTSPTGIHEVNRLDGACLEASIWDCFERLHADLRG